MFYDVFRKADDCGGVAWDRIAHVNANDASDAVKWASRDQSDPEREYIAVPAASVDIFIVKVSYKKNLSLVRSDR